MNTRTAISIRVACVLAVLSASVASAQPVTWNAEGARAIGSNCKSAGDDANTFFITADDDVSVLFTDFGIDLNEADGRSAAVDSCKIFIPITVKPRVALAELTQLFYWGYAKSKGTEAEVTGITSFFGVPATGITAKVGKNVEGVDSFRTEEAKDTFLHLQGRLCKRQPQKSFFVTTLTLAARRTSTNQSVSVRIHGEDVSYDVLANWVGC